MTRAAREGRLRVRARRDLLITDDWLLAMIEAFADHDTPPGSHAGAAWEQAGRNWGEAWYLGLQAEAATHSCTAEDLDLDDLLWLVEDELARGGWGRANFDLDSFAEAGIILATVRGGPASDRHEAGAGEVAEILAGFVAGVLGRVSDVPMRGVGICRTVGGATVAAVAAAHADRVAAVRQELGRGAAWLEALSRAGGAGG